MSASGAAVFGRMPLYPGAEVASSVMQPMPTAWWFRPVSKACRVGAHSAVVWNRVYFRPLAARRSATGVSHGPPNALDAAKPTSALNTTSTFGAPDGGRSWSLDGKLVAGSFASYVTRPV